MPRNSKQPRRYRALAGCGFGDRQICGCRCGGGIGYEALFVPLQKDDLSRTGDLSLPALTYFDCAPHRKRWLCSFGRRLWPYCRSSARHTAVSLAERRRTAALNPERLFAPDFCSAEPLTYLDPSFWCFGVSVALGSAARKVEPIHSLMRSSSNRV